MSSDITEAVARKFHETYERLAPNYGYITRDESNKPWDEVPENNRNLMKAVAEQMMVYMTSLDNTVLNDDINMESGVSVFDGHPYVTLQWGSERGQLSPAETRAHAMGLIETAEAAETDALLFRAFKRKGDDQVGQIAIQLLRTERKKGWGKRAPRDES